MKPKWTRTLSEVTLHETVVKEYISERTGNAYQTDVIPTFGVVSTGSVEKKENGFKYSVVDTKNGLEYDVTAPNQVEVRFGTILKFVNVRGGSLNSGLGWYKADSVEEVKRNA